MWGWNTSISAYRAIAPMWYSLLALALSDKEYNQIPFQKDSRCL